METSLHKRFGTDAALEQEGVWVDFGDGLQLRIIADSVGRVRDLRQRLQYGKYRSYYLRMNIPPHVEDAVNIEIATALITDWRGVTNGDGSAIPCAPEAVRQVMTDLRELRANVLFAASTAETFRRQEVEVMAKNSATPSTPA
jgi:hypothetical protein